MNYVKVWLMLIVVMGSISIAVAQEEKEKEEAPDPTTVVEDTLQLQQGAVGVNKPGTEAPDTIIIQSISPRIPRRAALYSAVLPGLGQAYNGKYWKIPIIYGGLITMGYFIILRNDQYQFFLRAEQVVGNNGANPLEDFPNAINRFRESRQLGNARDAARRNRDFMVILIAGLYGLNIMDAIADAHLIEFDINPDLSMDLKPMAGSALTYSDHLTPTIPSCGFSFTLSLY